MHALVAAKVLHFLACLVAEQILDGVENRAGMGLHRNPVFWLQRMKIQRCHDRCQRGGRCLMAADLQAITVIAQMIGIMDHPCREPQYLAFQFLEHVQVGHFLSPGCLLTSGNARIFRKVEPTIFVLTNLVYWL